MQKLDIKDVIQSLLCFDIFALNETFVDSDKFSHCAFTDYETFISKAVKMPDSYKKSGGVLVFVRKALSAFVRRIKVKYEHVVVLEMDKSLFNLNKNIFLLCMYIHPYNSKYWNMADYGYGIEVLEQCIVDLHEVRDDFSLI